MFVAKGLNQVEINNSYQSSTANPKTINGNTRYQLPVLRINVPAGVSVNKINIPYSPTLAKVILNVDGEITGNVIGVNEYLVENDTGLNIDITGSGRINARIKEEWIGPDVAGLGPDAQQQILVNWGYGGAVAAKIGWSATVSDGMDNPPNAQPYVLLKRNGYQNFEFFWNYSAQDYIPVYGDRTLDVSDVFGILFNSDGTFNNNHNALGDRKVQTHVDAVGRDVRHVSAATKVIDGRRHFWFASNNKNSSFDLTYMQFGVYYANWMTPGPSPGGSGRAYAPDITVSRSQRSEILSEVNTGIGVSNLYNLNNFYGTFVGTTV